jgi:hypothetical protein
LIEEVDDADGEDELDVVPEVPAALEPAGLVFRTNFEPLDALVVPVVVPVVVPDVPVAPGELGDALERSMHPVTVTLSAALELGVCELGGGVVCAAAAIVTAHTIAAANPMLFVIVPS